MLATRRVLGCGGGGGGGLGWAEGCTGLLGSRRWERTGSGEAPDGVGDALKIGCGRFRV